ncbi:Holliday junction branch migration protein RuvA [Anoxynatronum buryatiense]|uniref:Holliday junction branch migration complex subunit RuvA n=1 Tax=Anoxynatronum buryatiense TaxID=489973 RepID=A0AA45WUX6_9CLOT|nr:Holliday junction branch migration protein RuvA [Anoxynatronum buryatiense]SMP49489.1 Holliday junction DNA helicase subunit RuvA [Anoxynatronum buryatiense]
MIEFVKGTVHSVSVDQAIIDVNGIGYGVYSSLTTLVKLVNGQEVTLHTHYSLREDGASLYGFFSRNELDMFKKLITVTKVGPKAAVAILSTFSVENLCQEILAHNLDSLSKAPGIGKKTAERIVLELKDKVKKMGYTETDIPVQINSFEDEVLEALMALGYHKTEALEAVRATTNQGISTEEGIKAALSWLMK